MTISTTQPPLTLSQVARALGVSKRTVTRRVSDGSIKVLRIGRIVRVTEAEMDRVLASK